MSDITSKDRKKRVKKLKKLILYSILVAILIPIGINIYQGVRIHRLKEQVSELQQELQGVTALTMQQEAVIAQMEEAVISEEPVALTEEDSIRAWENMEKPEGDFVPAGGSIRKVYLTFDDGPMNLPCSPDHHDHVRRKQVDLTFDECRIFL